MPSAAPITRSRSKAEQTVTPHQEQTPNEYAVRKTMKRSKKDIQAIKEVKRALDAALADGTISKAVYDLINRPGLETRNKGSS